MPMKHQKRGCIDFYRFPLNPIVLIGNAKNIIMRDCLVFPASEWYVTEQTKNLKHSASFEYQSYANLIYIYPINGQ